MADGVSPPAEQRIDDAYIDELIKDAHLYATYGRYAGSFRDAKLFQAIASALQERPISTRLVVELQRILNETAQDIPFSTVAALKSGWTPGRQPWRVSIVAIGLVLFSILMMVVVARLTLVHNTGAALVVTAEALIEDRPQQTIDRLLREHVTARLQLEDRVTPSNDILPLDDTTTLIALEANEAELRDVTRRIALLRVEVDDYIIEESAFPLLGMKKIYCATGALLERHSTFYNAHCNAQPNTNQLQGFATCPAVLGRDDIPANTGALEAWHQLLQAEESNMICNGIIASTDFREASFKKNLEYLRKQVGYYALWLLPAIYGAMGAVMFHMRWVLNPLLPHPSLLNLLHRIVLGSLAGIVLGWFYAPGSAVGDAATAVGFSLFILAFIIGFSLDIFFAMLDRFVTYGEKTIRGAKGDQEEGQPLFTNKNRQASKKASAPDPDPHPTVI